MSQKVEITMEYVDQSYDDYKPNDKALKEYIALNGVSYREEGVKVDGRPWRWVAVSRGSVPQRSGVCYTITLGYWSPKWRTPCHHSFVYSAEEIDELRWWKV